MAKERLEVLPVRVPSELKSRLDAMAAKSGQTRADFIRMVLDEATRDGMQRRDSSLPPEVVDRLMHAVLFTEASFEEFLSQREGLADELKDKAKQRMIELYGDDHNTRA